MAILDTIDMESNNISTEFPDFVTGTYTIVTSATVAIPQGTYALQVPFQVGGVAQLVHTASADLYVLTKLRINVGTEPASQAVIQLIMLKTSTDAVIAYLDVILNPGVITLRLVNNVVFAAVATTTLTNNIWYDVAVRVHVAASPNGILELKVDNTSIGGGPVTNLDTGTVSAEKLGVAASADPLDSAAGFAYFDWIILDNAAYPTYGVAAYEQTHYRWRNDDGSLAAP